MKIKYSAITGIPAAIAAVKRDSYSLRFVKDQTEEICLAAVNQNGYSLQFVKDQTEAICLVAVKQNVGSLQFVLDFELFVKLSKKFGIEIEIEN